MDRPKLTGFRFAPRVTDTLDWLTDRLSMGRTDVISLALRRLAQAEGRAEPDDAAKPGRKTISKIPRK